MQRLAAAENGGERLDRRADDVHLRLLRRQRDACRLRVEAHEPGAGVLRPVALPQLARPDAPRRAVLGDLLEEVDVRVEEEGEPRRELVHAEPALHRRLHVGEPVREREGELLRGRRARLADVVARDGDRVPERHLAGAVLDHVHAEPHGRLRREDPLLLGDVLLEDVRLDRPAQAFTRYALFLGDADIEGEQHGGRRVDRHRGGDLAQRDAGEEQLHVLQRVDRHALAAHLAEGLGMVGVVPHERRHVEGGGQPRLPVLEQVAEARVRLLRGPEARELAHRPQPAPVHRGVDAPRVRVHAGPAQVALVVDLDVVRRVERLGGKPRDRREQPVPLGLPLVQLPAPRLRGIEAAAVLGRGHVAESVRGGCRPQTSA